jgi:hypothetical protein
LGLPEKGKPLWDSPGLNCSELENRPGSWRLLIAVTADSHEYTGGRKYTGSGIAVSYPVSKAMDLSAYGSASSGIRFQKVLLRPWPERMAAR